MDCPNCLLKQNDLERTREKADALKRKVTKLGKRDSEQTKALKAAKKAFEFSHGYSVKGETTKIGKAYKLVVDALKN